MTDYYIKLKKEYLNILSLCNYSVLNEYINYSSETKSYFLGTKNTLSAAEAHDFQFTSNMDFFDIEPVRQQLFYLRLKVPVSFDKNRNYLCFSLEDEHYVISNKIENSHWKTKFNKKELEYVFRTYDRTIFIIEEVKDELDE